MIVGTLTGCFSGAGQRHGWATRPGRGAVLVHSNGKFSRRGITVLAAAKILIVLAKITFDDENGDVIRKANLAAEIGCDVKDIVHEFFGGPRRAAPHYLRKTLDAEFFAKAVLCFRDAIRIENQHVTGTQVCRGHFTKFLWKYSYGWAGRIHACDCACL